MDIFSDIYFGMLLNIFAKCFLSYMVFWQNSSIFEIQRGIQKEGEKGKRRAKKMEKRTRMKSRDHHAPGVGAQAVRKKNDVACFVFGGVWIYSK